MLECIYQKIETYRDSAAVLCAYKTKGDLCDSFFLGFLMKTFTRFKIYSPNISERDNYQASLSIQGLKNVLDGLTIPNIVLQDGTSGRCDRCGYPRPTAHAYTCSPMPGLKRRVGVMLTEIRGLEWTQFVRNSSIGGATTGPKNQDLWDYLEYN